MQSKPGGWTVRRLLGSALSTVLLLGVLAAAEPATAAPCSVKNARTGVRYPRLQKAVHTSAQGDILMIRGICARSTNISEKTLRLKGVSTPAEPTPTLDGGGVGRVLVLRNAHIVIRDLTITNGKAQSGGGIYKVRGQLTLTGTTSVTGNRARWVAGIENRYGRLTLKGSSSVDGNTAGTSIGGIYNHHGTVVLNDSSSVTGNTAKWQEAGGIAAANGSLTLNDSSSVTGNTAGSYAGGIFLFDGAILTLNDSSSVTGNTAKDHGGGVFSEWNSRIYVCSGQVAISPNDPDDPPKVRHVCP
jgi:hypothetical protein